jgi:hydroxypyruvate isomerase
MNILSSNLEYMFKEAGDTIEQRIAAAAKAGINHVEIFSTDDRDIDGIAATLIANKVTLHTMLVDPRIMLVLKDTHGKFLEVFRATAENAVKLGCNNLVCGSGTGAPFLNRKISLDNVTEAISQAADIAQEYGLNILLEAVNTRVDHPGVFFSRTEDTFYIANKLNRANVKVLYDLYHSVAEGEDVATTLLMIRDQIGHIQVADYPGRGEPGAGKLDWQEMLSLIKQSNYSGPIGVECYPTTATSKEALTYFRSLL